MFTDNKEFYPTPRELFRKLIDGKRYFDGRILEPSAGKGDLIKYIREINRNARVDAIENDPRLVNALMGEGFSVVWDDFLTYETYKEYDYIVMNPPFSNGVDHALKALELAEKQLSACQLYIILNKETLNNAYSSKRQELLRKLDEHGADIEYVADAFTQAERKTDVEVALIRACVKKAGAGKSIYDRIPFGNVGGKTEETLETALSTYVKASEVQAKMNDIERLVIEYETACELARDTYKAIRDKSSFFSYIGEVNKRPGDASTPFTYVVQKEYRAEDLNAEIDRLRSAYWSLILDTDDFRKLLTNEAIQKLNRQLEAANEMEINLPNIRMLLMALGANQRDILVDSVVSIFEKITRYHMNHYSTNIHYYNGWKTNDAYKINKKIIIPIKWQYTSRDFSTDFDRIDFDTRNYIIDIVKAFQLIDPNVSDTFTSISKQEFENDLLRFKMFKNGNIHVWFKRLDLLAKLNYLCGSHFGWIPGEDEQKENPKAREYVVKEFGEDVLSVKLLENFEGKAIS